MTLYTFDKGIDCIGVCLANWTPLAAPALARSWGDWTAVERADGSRQRAHKGQVLYLSGRDASPGDIAGEDTAHGWRAAIVRPAAGVPDGFIQQTADLGRVVADAGGLTVYTMAESPLRPKFCDDACLKTEWRPVAAGGGGASAARLVDRPFRQRGGAMGLQREIALHFQSRPGSGRSTGRPLRQHVERRFRTFRATPATDVVDQNFRLATARS